MCLSRTNCESYSGQRRMGNGIVRFSITVYTNDDVKCFNDFVLRARPILSRKFDRTDGEKTYIYTRSYASYVICVQRRCVRIVNCTQLVFEGHAIIGQPADSLLRYDINNSVAVFVIIEIDSHVGQRGVLFLLSVYKKSTFHRIVPTPSHRKQYNAKSR